MKKFNLTKKNLQFYLVLTTGVFYLTAFTAMDLDKNPPKKMYGPDDWSDYKSWHKITTEPSTGDSTGFLQGKHRGTIAFRDIFINAIGKDACLNKQFPLPDGTIILKEAFKDEKACIAQKGPELTIMMRSTVEGSEDTGNYIWYMGGSGSDKMKGAGMDIGWG